MIIPLREALIFTSAIVTGVAIDVANQAGDIPAPELSERVISSVVEYGIIGIVSLLFYWLWSKSDARREKMTDDRINELERERDKAQLEAKEARKELLQVYRNMAERPIASD